MEGSGETIKNNGTCEIKVTLVVITVTVSGHNRTKLTFGEFSSPYFPLNGAAAEQKSFA